MEFVQPVDPEFVCGVCTQPWVEPLTTPCEHIFCKDCIGDMALKNGSTCPTCHAPVDVDALRPPLPQLLALAERSLRVYCPNRKRIPPCDAVLKRSEYVGHIVKCRVELKYQGPVSEELQCSICHQPWEEPREIASCGHIFCERCIESVRVRDPKCPLCNHAFGQSDLREPSRYIVNMLDELKVACPVAVSTGCGWVGRRGDLQSHFKPTHAIVAAAATAVSGAGTGSTTTTPSPAKTTELPLLQVTSVNEFSAVKTAQSDHKIVTMAHIQAPVMPDTVPRKPIAITASIDISGSMGGSKIELVQTALRFVVSELQAHDQLGIIAFDDEIEEPLSLTSMDQEGKTRALKAIEQLKPDGSTNLSGGLFAGIEQLRGLPISELKPVPRHRDTFQVVPPVRSTRPTPVKKSGVLSTISKIFRSSTPKSSTAPAPHDLAPINCSFTVRITHDYTQMKRDGKWLHVYNIQCFVEDYVGAEPVESVLTKLRLVRGNAAPQQAAYQKVASGTPNAKFSFESENEVGEVVIEVLLRDSSNHTEPTCPSNHTLKWCDALPSKYTGGVVCDECKQPIDVTSGFHHCGTCKYDRCNACMEARDIITYRPGGFDVGSLSTKIVVGSEEPTEEKGTVSPKPQAARSDAMRYLWLFTDGLANCGITDATQLISETKKRLASNSLELSGISTFGFGTDHNAALLQSIAEACQGSYFFIKSTELIKGVFGECLGGLLSIVAQNITIELAPGSGVTVQKLLTTLPKSGDGVIILKDLYSEETRDILVELSLSTPANETASLPLLSWVVRYTDVFGVARTVRCEAVTRAKKELTAEEAVANVQVDVQRNRILAAATLEEARKRADKGDTATAKAQLRKAMETIQTSISATDADTAQLYKDMETACDATDDWHAGGKVVTQMANMHAMQRSNACESSAAYQTATRCEKKAKAMSFM